MGEEKLVSEHHGLSRSASSKLVVTLVLLQDPAPRSGGVQTTSSMTVRTRSRH